MRILVRPQRIAVRRESKVPDWYLSQVNDKTGLNSADIVYDAEFERWMHIGEDAAFGKGPGGRYYGPNGAVEGPGDQRRIRPGEEEGVLTDAKGKFKGYIDGPTGQFAPYNGAYPEGHIKYAKEKLQDPWYLATRDCGLKVGLGGVLTRCKNAGLSYAESEAVPGATTFCIKEQREAINHLVGFLHYGFPSRTTKDVYVLEETLPKTDYSRAITFPAHTVNQYKRTLSETRDEAIVGVYDALGVPSPKGIKRTQRMDILRPFGAVVASHTLGEVGDSPSEIRRQVADKVAAAVDAALAEYDACLKRTLGES